MRGRTEQPWIEQQYDEMVRYGTALIERTADPETILRRFTRSNVQHSPRKCGLLSYTCRGTKTLAQCVNGLQ